jgi:hypothetical protein
MEDDITQPSVITEVGMRVLPKSNNSTSTRNGSRSNFQRLINNKAVYTETIV